MAGQGRLVHFRKLSEILPTGDESNKQTQGGERQKKRKGAVPGAEEVARTALLLAAGCLNRNSAAYNPHYPSIWSPATMESLRRAVLVRLPATQRSDVQADTALPDMKWIISTRPFSCLAKENQNDESPFGTGY